MDDRLKLTEAEIEQFLAQAREDPPAPVVISLGDINGSRMVPRTGAPLLRITEDDLLAAPPQYGNAPNLIELETLMFGLVNSARQANLPRWLGGPNLRWHEELAAVARGHSLDMLRRGYVDHTTPEGIKVAKRIDQQRIGYLACGENIGVVYGAASHSEEGVYEIHRAFMNQPRRLANHRGNLLNPIWTHVGIGAAYDETGTLVLTQNFISKLG
ncbi:MAG: CAP domain-containing protein [Candidatus Promineifilaceae bacterium]